MTKIVRRRRRADADRPAVAAATRTWSPEDLYSRSVENRRVMFLELLAWAVAQAEAPRSREEFRKLEVSLIEARVATGWGQHPWLKATDPERFLKHVHDVAVGFTTGRGAYTARPGAD